MRISFERGVPSAAAQVLGGGLVIGAPAHSLAWWVGWALIAFGVGLLIWGFRIDGNPWWQGIGRKFPERHKEVLRELAAPLATVQDQALTYGQRDLAKMGAAKSAAEALVSEIPYDPSTVRVVRTFNLACYLASVTHNTADEFRKARDDVQRMAPYLFECLHAGKSVDDRKICLPDWALDGAVSPAPVPQPEQPAQAAHWTHDNYKGEFAYHAREKPIERDTPLTEALAYAATGQWGETFFNAVARNNELPRDANDVCEHFRQRAGDGALTVWGKNSPTGIYQKIPAVHWTDHRLAWFELLRGTARSEPATEAAGGHYTDLMVSRAEVEGEWP